MNFEYPRNLLGSVNVEISVYIKCRIFCWERLNVPQSQVTFAGVIILEGMNINTAKNNTVMHLEHDK